MLSFFGQGLRDFETFIAEKEDVKLFYSVAHGRGCFDEFDGILYAGQLVRHIRFSEKLIGEHLLARGSRRNGHGLQHRVEVCVVWNVHRGYAKN